MEMRPNSIIVQLDIDAQAQPLIAFSLGLAEYLDADLIGFCAAEPMLIIPGDIDGSASVEAMRVQVDAINGQLKTLEAEFKGLCKDRAVASWCGTIGNPTQLLAVHARAADLVVTSAPRTGTARDSRRTVDLGSLVLTAGRPVFVAAEPLTPFKADRVLVAWKDTREARRAVSDALPLLTKASEVVVATIEEDGRAAARDGVADVTQYLIKHGVHARPQLVDAGGADAGDALAQLASDLQADLVVSGGYGHSRLREWAFGGVTRSLLQEGSVNRFFSN
jgi:nucleotide-binding universal stress UspA family protein